MAEFEYVHGFSRDEARRLSDQAATLTDLLHHDTHYPPGSRVLEVGCGVGAQTVALAARSPRARITAVDLSAASLAEAEARVRALGHDHLRFERADVFELPFAAESFDHVFVCFVLEHLQDPGLALSRMLEVLVPGGTLTVIEGDHGSSLFHPESEAARRVIECLVSLQARAGGDSLIGRRLYPLLLAAGLRDVRVRPRLVYADASRPDLVEGFTLKTFTAMIRGVREAALEQKLLDAEAWDRGIHALERTAEVDGTFSYTFYKGVGVK